MRKGVSQLVMPGKDLRQAMEAAASAGYQGFEVRLFADGPMSPRAPESEFRAARETARDLGLEICSVVGGLPDGASLAAADDGARKLAVETTEVVLERAAIMGADTMLVVPGSVSPENRYDHVYERTLESLAALRPAAERIGVSLAVENVWNKFLLSPLEARALVDAVGGPNVGFYFDVGNFVPWAYPEQWVEILGPRIKKVHFKDFRRRDYRFVPLTEGDVDWPRVMAALRSAGYDDYVISEVDGPDEMLKITSATMDRILEM
jgi:hexulose-6-phosphate isomerase